MVSAISRMAPKLKFVQVESDRQKNQNEKKREKCPFAESIFLPFTSHCDPQT
jgi:hypothetical protein